MRCFLQYDVLSIRTKKGAWEGEREMARGRCNKLCTKASTGQCALCDKLAERERFERPFWAVVASCTTMTRWLRTHAPLAWNRVTRFANGFFFDKDAFTFKGITTFALQMLGSVLGICIAAQLFAHPADVRARNSEPVGCLDINQYEESFALMGVDYPKKLREVIDRFVNKTEYEKAYGPTHHFMCWYVTPRSERRQQEVRELASKMFRTVHDFRSDWVMNQVEHARRLALGTDSTLQLGRERELSPSAALRHIPSLSSDAIYLDVKVVMKPSDSRSVYTAHGSWEGRISYTNIAGIQEFIDGIEQAGIQDLELAWAFEKIYDARWFINWVELQNLSSHATVAKATLSIYHGWRGVAEFLGGTLDITQRGQYFSARVERLLPGEQLWGLIRTKTPIEDSALQVISDPTLVFDRAYLEMFLKRYCLLLIPVLFLWWLGNWHTRRVQREFQE
jgi:hypothetical protein